MIIVAWHPLEIGKHYNLELSRSPSKGPEETHLMGFIIEREATEQEWKDYTLETFGEVAKCYENHAYWYKLLVD